MKGDARAPHFLFDGDGTRGARRHVLRCVAFAGLPAVSLAATALYMGGTDHPLSIPEDTTAYITTYIQWAYNDFVGPSGLCTGGNPGCAQTAVYPEQFWPTTGLKDLTYDQSIAQGLPLLDNCLRGLACTVTDPHTTTGSQILTDTSYTVFSHSQVGRSPTSRSPT